MQRRQFITATLGATAALPFLTARELARRTPPTHLPPVTTGSVLTADYFNRIVARLNTLTDHAA